MKIKKIDFEEEWSHLIMPDDWVFRNADEKDFSYQKFQITTMRNKINEIIDEINQAK